MKTEQYEITGMTCGSCLAKVKEVLNKEGISSNELTLKNPTLNISEKAESTKMLNQKLKSIGNYRAQKIEVIANSENETYPPINTETYKPLILIISFVFGVSLFAQFPFEQVDFMLLMRHFMAGFFIAFSFFKFLNLKGFSASFRMYDPIAKKSKSWSFIYPFIELILGILYLTNSLALITNWTAILVLGISSVGVSTRSKEICNSFGILPIEMAARQM